MVMIGKRIRYCILVAGMAVTIAGCATSTDQRPHRATTTPGASTPSAGTGEQPEEVLRPLHQQELPNANGKTFTSAIVDFPPSASAVPHRHGNAFVYAYVLNGSVTSRQEGERMGRTYRRGEYWVEPPGVHHVQTDNASKTKPAKLLVAFISNTGDPLKIPDQPKSSR